MHKVLLLESIHPDALTLLKEHTEVISASAPDKGLDYTDQFSFASIITRGKGKVDEALIEACHGLRVIARCGVGLDNIDVSAASHKGIKVLNAPGVNTDTVAEHTLGLILMAVRNLYSSLSEVKNAYWGSRNTLPTDEIHYKKLGILGLGNIGYRLAELASAFKMEVEYWDIHQKECPWPFKSFEEILSTADIISLHLPLTTKTRSLIGKDKIAQMKEGVVLANCARGGIVDESAILNALNTGKIGFYVGDVLEKEPPASDHPLIQHPNCLITPHSASLTARTYRELCMLSVQNVICLLNNQLIDSKYWFNKIT